MNAGLVVLGLILMGGMFFLVNVYITPQQKQQLELVSTACNFNIWGIPVGQIGQAISSDVAQKCEQVKTIKQILSLQPFVYILGFILLVAGLVTGGKKEVQVIREIVKEPEREAEGEMEEMSKEKIKKKGYKFCPVCGSEVKPGEKFCGNCGNKLT